MHTGAFPPYSSFRPLARLAKLLLLVLNWTCLLPAQAVTITTLLTAPPSEQALFCPLVSFSLK